VRIYPNLGAVQLAFARLGFAWQAHLVLSAHGRPLAPVVRAALGGVKLAILTDAVHTPAAVARALLEAGMEPLAETWCMERLGGSAERTQHGTLGECAAWTADPLNVLVIVRSAALEAVIFAGWALSTGRWTALVFRCLSGFILGNTGVMLAVQASTTPKQRLALAVGIVGAGSPAGQSPNSRSTWALS